MTSQALKYDVINFVSMFYAMFYKPSSTLSIYATLTWAYQCS